MGAKSTLLKRVLSGMLAAVLVLPGVLSAVSPSAAAAADYVYNPPAALYSDGKKAAFFDYNMTALAELAKLDTGAAQRSYLTAQGMNLNSHGTLITDNYNPYNMTAPGVFNGSLTPANQEDAERRAVAHYDYEPLLRHYRATQNDNLYNVRRKGDLTFTVSGSVYVRQYDNMLTGQDKSTAASVYFLGNSYQFDGKDTPNSWGKINMLGDNKSSDGLLSFAEKSWRDCIGVSGKLIYRAESRNGGPTDSRLRNFIVVGKDSQGPSILAVDLQLSSGSNPPAKDNHPLTVDYGEPNPGWSGNVTGILREDIGKTLFISVMFDEPVKFSDDWATPQNLSNLGLQLRTIGKDGSSAQLAEAKFHSYYPGQYDDCPIMTFAYTIQDPSVGERKDLQYTFTDIAITDSENRDIFNNLVDLSGNKFNMKNGNQTSQTIPLRNEDGKRTTVDLEGLTVDNVVFKLPSWMVGDVYMRPGRYVDVELHLNKLLPETTTSNPANLPTLRMNFSSDTLTATVQQSPPSSSLMPYTVLSYRATVKDGDNTPGSDPIRLASITIPNGCVDDSGYKLTCDLGSVVYDKSLFVDTTKPQLDLKLVEVLSGLYLAELTIIDDHPGTSAQFILSHNAEASGVTKYAPSGTAEYDISKMTEADGNRISFNAPVVKNPGDTYPKSYAFLLLPDDIKYISSISAWADTTDEAGNRSESISVTVTPAKVDNVPPDAFFTGPQSRDGEFSTKITMGDRSPYSYDYIWVAGTDTTSRPANTAAWLQGNSSNDGKTLIETLTLPLIMEPGKNYEYVLWVRIIDDSDNEAFFAQPFAYYKNDYTLEIISYEGIDYDNPGKIFYLIDGIDPSVTVRPGSSVNQIRYNWGGADKTIDVVPGESCTIRLSADLTPAQIQQIGGPVTLSLSTNGSNPPVKITFNVLYEPEMTGELLNSRFSTLNRYGAEDRRILNGNAAAGNQLRDIDSNSTAINGFSLHNMAEMEILFKKGASTNASFEAVKDVRVTLKQIEFTDSDGKMSGQPGTWKFDDTTRSENVVYSWELTADDFFPATGNDYAATIRITDLSTIEQVPCRVDADGRLIRLVRYELWAETSYLDTNQTTDTLLNTFVFYDAEISDVRISDVEVRNGGGLTPDYTAPELYQAVLSGSGAVTDHSVAVPRVNLRRAEQGTFAPHFMVYDLPKTALDMIAASGNGTGTNSENFQMLYVGGLNSIKYNEELRLYYIDETAGGTRLAVSYPDSDRNVFPTVSFTGEKPQRLYYQIADERTKEKGIFYSPIYCVDIVSDDIPPVIYFEKSSTAPTAGAVTVQYNVSDGYTGAGGVFVSDTPVERIALDITAAYDDAGFGAPELDPLSNTYTFRANGTLSITATDLSGNKTQRSISVTNIDRTPPVIFPAGNYVEPNLGMYDILIETSDGAVAADLRFDEAYTKAKLMTAEDAAAVDWTALGGDLTHPDWPSFPIETAVNGLMGSLRGIYRSEIGYSSSNPGELTSVSVRGYVSTAIAPEVGLEELCVMVYDALGNAAHSTLNVSTSTMGAYQYLYCVTAKPIDDPNLHPYKPGGGLGFNTPVQLRLAGQPAPEADGAYLDYFNNLPIYETGSFDMVITDLFGQSSSHTYLAEMDDYVHKVTVEPSGKTNGNVTVTIDTTMSLADVKEGTDGIYTVIMENNGNVTYTIVPDPNSGSPEREFTVAVTNIDRVAPTASVRREVNGTEGFDDEGNATIYGSVTYTIVSFDEPNVTMADGAPLTHTFTEAGSHTFRFVDEAGNEGTLTVTETANFAIGEDTVITKLRASYAVGSGGEVYLDEFSPGSRIEIKLDETTDENIKVYLKAYDKDGNELSVTLGSAVPVDGVGVNTNDIVFIKNAETTVTVNSSGGSVSVTVAVVDSIKTPTGTTPPTGTVRYVVVDLTDDNFVKGGVKAYIVPDDPNDVVKIEYEDAAGAEVTIHTDTEGKFVYYANNGTGSFLLYDEAGNVGRVHVGIYIDPPDILEEGWFGSGGTSGDEALTTPTNNPVRIVLRFNELLSGADIEAYDESGHKLEPLSDYIRYTLSSNMLTLEFRKNCQARITVFDIRGNGYTILRPEDGPITVIDREAPRLTGTEKDSTGNVVKITYTFSEPVRSANSSSELNAVQIVTYTENGVYPRTFADNAGNVFTVVETITEIDNTSPTLSYLVRAVPGGTEGKDYLVDGGGNLIATKGNLELLLLVSDASPVTLTVTNRSALELETISETLGTTTFTQKAVITENGTYEVTAADTWNNTVVRRIKIDIIDRDAPIISLASTRSVNMTPNNTEQDLKEALMTGVTARDGREGDVTGKIVIDYDGKTAQAILSGAGNHTIYYTVADSLGNTAERRSRVIRVSSGETVKIGGETVWSGDIFVTKPGELTITASPKYTLYAMRGLLTYGEMKYAPVLTGGTLSAKEPGYYTLLAQGSDREVCLVYVFVY